MQTSFSYDGTPHFVHFAYKFTGKERDAESGLDYFGARYYASNMGRFMSPDWAAKAQPVPYAKTSNPQSLNLYAYVGNNPLIRFDPNGHNWFTDFFKNTWQRVDNEFHGNGFVTNAQRTQVTTTETYNYLNNIHNTSEDPSTNAALHNYTTSTVDLFGNSVAQVGGNYSFGGAGLSYVPSTGNVYGTLTGGTPGVGIYGVVGPTSDLNQAGAAGSAAAFFGIGGTVSVTPDGATTTGVGFGTPGVGIAGGYSWLLGTLPAATFNINTLNLPDGPSVYPSGGFYVDDEYNSYGQRP